MSVILSYLRQVAECQVVGVLVLGPVAPPEAQVTLVVSSVKGGYSVLVWFTALKVIDRLLPGQGRVSIKQREYKDGYLRKQKIKVLTGVSIETGGQ